MLDDHFVAECGGHVSLRSLCSALYNEGGSQAYHLCTTMLLWNGQNCQWDHCTGSNFIRNKRPASNALAFGSQDHESSENESRSECCGRLCKTHKQLTDFLLALDVEMGVGTFFPLIQPRLNFPCFLKQFATNQIWTSLSVK